MFCKAQQVIVEPYKTELNQKFITWLESKGIESSGKELDFTGNDALALEFQVEVQTEYYKEMDCNVIFCS